MTECDHQFGASIVDDLVSLEMRTKWQYKQNLINLSGKHLLLLQFFDKEALVMYHLKYLQFKRFSKSETNWYYVG